jgi:hypothetical protein
MLTAHDVYNIIQKHIEKINKAQEDALSSEFGQDHLKVALLNERFQVLNDVAYEIEQKMNLTSGDGGD